jgi:hypothetical protein
MLTSYCRPNHKRSSHASLHGSPTLDFDGTFRGTQVIIETKSSILVYKRRAFSWLSLNTLASLTCMWSSYFAVAYPPVIVDVPYHKSRGTPRRYAKEASYSTSHSLLLMSLHHQFLKRPMQLLGLNALRAPATSWDAPGVIFLKLLAVVSRLTTEWAFTRCPTRIS